MFSHVHPARELGHICPLPVAGCGDDRILLGSDRAHPGPAGLLQQRQTWSGSELAERLGTTTRTIRRDVDRLRELGYPVNATQGVAGGYRLGAGRALPPLLLDDAEAVAVAVSLRLAAGGTVAGASEAALRALTKLDQVLPSRLRQRVHGIHDSISTLPGGPSAETVDADALVEIAGACRDLVRLEFAYADRSGAITQRRVEPYGLVATGRRWYLMAYDLDRDDWRTFRSTGSGRCGSAPGGSPLASTRTR